MNKREVDPMRLTRAILPLRAPYYMLLVLCAAIMLAACRKPQAVSGPLVDETKPILVIGSDDPSATGPGNYKTVLDCQVDRQGNIYIPDQVEKRIDKYDPRGNYLHSIGRPGQGPGEFQNIGKYAANSQGEVFAHSFSLLSIMIFDAMGSYSRMVPIPEKYRTSFVTGMGLDSHDNLYMMFVSRQEGSSLARFSPDLGSATVIHVDQKRKPLDYSRASALPPLHIGFSFDDSGNIYIADAIDYRVYVYDEAGKLVRTFEQERPRKQFAPGDLVFLLFGQVRDGRDATAIYFGRLEGDDRYLPNIFGIDVDQDRIYLWTSDRDDALRYVIDIYDKKFRLLGHSSAYGLLPRRQTMIRNRRLYTPNLAPEDLNAVRKVGRLSWLNEPSKLLVYDIIWPKKAGNAGPRR